MAVGATILAARLALAEEKLIGAVENVRTTRALQSLNATRRTNRRVNRCTPCARGFRSRAPGRTFASRHILGSETSPPTVSESKPTSSAAGTGLSARGDRVRVGYVSRVVCHVCAYSI